MIKQANESIEQANESIENLNNENADVTIAIEGNLNESAGDGMPEDTLSGFKKMVEAQNETIAALIEQNKSLQSQLTEYVRNNGFTVSGANQNTGTFENDVPVTQREGYVSLSELGKSFGRENIDIKE